jgi:hypothetical protein
MQEVSQQIGQKQDKYIGHNINYSQQLLLVLLAKKQQLT